MNSLYIMIPIALILVGVFVTFYLWAIRTGQFDDLDTPATKIITDNDSNLKDAKK